MGKPALFAVIAGAVIVVAALAVITPTVLVRDHDGRRGERIMRFEGPGPAPLPGFRACVERRGGPMRCRGFAPALPGR